MRRLAAPCRLTAALALAATTAGCGGAPAPAPPPGPAPVPAPATPVFRDRAYALSWGGAALGWAREDDDGQRWQRREQVVVRRGDVVVASELSLVIDRDPDGRPRSVALARWQDGPVLRGRATAVADGWRVEVEGEPGVTLPPATPFELALAGAARAGGFRGRVLLAGYGFAIADLTVAPEGDPAGRRWAAALTLDGHPLTASLRYDADGAIDEIRGADGVVARVVDELAAARPRTPLEVVGGNAVAVEGADGAPPGGLWLPEASGPPPPALPGQRVIATADPPGWTVRLEPGAPTALPPGPRGDRSRELAALTREVADAIEDDLGATALTAGGARAASRGDCTTHALRFAALAADAGLEVRVVTGLRLDGGALLRHRWIVAWDGARWRAIDPTYAEAPAAPVLLGLAVHGARAADLATADAVVFDHVGSRAIALP